MDLSPPPLVIIQARMRSARLPGKMLMELGGETLIARGYRLACEAFGADHVVVAIPGDDAQGPLAAELTRIGATWVPVFGAEAAESDLLARFYHVAHMYRWLPESVIVRWTPDDPLKSPEMCRRVAAGERLPVELGAEAFTLAMLDAAYFGGASEREHLTRALFPVPPPPAPSNGMQWTVDTADDLGRARECVELLQSAIEARALMDEQDAKPSRRRKVPA